MVLKEVVNLLDAEVLTGNSDPELGIEQCIFVGYYDESYVSLF